MYGFQNPVYVRVSLPAKKDDKDDLIYHTEFNTGATGSLNPDSIRWR
jgi:hypothetical protein